MVQNMKGKLSGIFKKKLTRVLIVFVILALVAGGLFKFNVIKLKSQSTFAQQQRTARVTKGTINTSVTGSGSIASTNRTELTSKVAGTITKVNFKEGDTVKKGDLLFEIDDSDAKLSVAQVENNISQAQLTNETNSKNITNLKVRAPFDGRVTNIVPKVGDVLGKNANVLTITDVSKLKIVLPFSGSSSNLITKGQKASVYIQDIMQSVDGDVTYVSSSSYATSLGGEVYDVEITLNNPGSLKEGMRASAEIDTSSGAISSTDVVQMEYVNSETLKCDAGGTVKSISVRENDLVHTGDLLAEVENDDLAITAKTNEIKMQDLNSQLETAEETLSDYKVYSTIDGIIVTQNVKVGDNANRDTSLAVISDLKNLEFEVSIDELDIANIKKDQNVKITADALEETSTTPLTGVVTDIAVEGTSSNGVTTYPVTVKVNEADKLKVGMNVNAEIMISEKTDVLRVPLEAVTKMGDNKGMVFIKGNGQSTGDNSMQGGNWENRNRNGGNSGNQQGSMPSGMPNDNQQGNSSNGSQQRNSSNGNQDGSSSNGNGQGNSSNRNQQSNSSNSGNTRVNRVKNANAQYYANAVMVMVDLGVNNDSYIEITSGLKEGDEVILPPLTTSSSSSSAQMQGGMGMGMGMGMGVSGPGGFSGGNRNFNDRNSSSQRSSGSSSGNSSRGN